jgi:DNA-directed RNA polymerase specialized sigma24 family protein
MADRPPADEPTRGDPARQAAVTRVEAALAALPLRQRIVFELRVRREMTVAEARVAIGASTDKVVERLYAHAVEALRVKLL